MKRLFHFTAVPLLVCLVLILAAVPLFGADVQVKYSGPSGQGQLIIWSPEHGLTNLVVSSNGVSTITLAPGVELTVTSADLVVAADGTFGGDVVADTLSATNGAVSALTTVSGADLHASDDLIVLDDAWIAGDLVVTGSVTSASTVSGTGYKIGAVSAGSCVITNYGGATTNIYFFTGGVYMSNTVFTGE